MISVLTKVLVFYKFNFGMITILINMTATVMAHHCVWHKRMLNDVLLKQKQGTITFCDKKSTITMKNNPNFHGRTNHIGLRFYFTPELVNKDVVMQFCSIEVQVVSIFTKAFANQRHGFLRH